MPHSPQSRLAVFMRVAGGTPISCEPSVIHGVLAADLGLCANEVGMILRDLEALHLVTHDTAGYMLTGEGRTVARTLPCERGSLRSLETFLER